MNYKYIAYEQKEDIYHGYSTTSRPPSCAQQLTEMFLDSPKSPTNSYTQTIRHSGIFRNV
jgi:hypothetical protein